MRAPIAITSFLAALLLTAAGAVAAMEPPVPPWQAELGRDHPLAGVIWAPRGQQRLTPSAVIARAEAADFVLLGEVHDNPDAHRLQAWVLGAMIEQGRRPAVAFEMFDGSQAKGIALQIGAAPRDADALAAAVGWEDSGWPDFAMYRPIVQAALEAELPVLPANLPPDVIRAVVRGGDIPADIAKAIAAADALPPAQQEALASDIRDSHCGHLPEAMIAPMTRAQKARDVVMARALSDGAARDGSDGAVLIAGNGHTRADRAVPFHLRRLAPDAEILSIGFIEVEAGKTQPAQYGELYGEAGAPPFDIVWFTPRQQRPDPCEALERRMREHGKAD